MHPSKDKSSDVHERGLQDLYLSLICGSQRLMLALELVKGNRSIFYREIWYQKIYL